MHPNPVFRGTPAERNLAFARDRGFGLLATSDPAGPHLAHVPFLLSTDGAQAEVHLVRSNPIARQAKDRIPAVIAVSGPDGYVSPDWYGVADQVPTWNYVAVHLRGTLTPVAPDQMHPMLDRLSAHFEERLAPKRPWTSGKMSPGTMDRMMRAILPFRFDVTQVDGTWKLNQNKDDAVRVAAAEHMAAYGIGQETDLLAAFMHAAGAPASSPDEPGAP